MPYKSDAQRKYFHANRAKLERAGVSVKEWDRATAGRKLPSKVKPIRNKKSTTTNRKSAKKK